MKTAVLALVVTLCVPCVAQTAKVVQLSDKDAAQIKALYQEKAAIEKKIDDFTQHVLNAYLSYPMPEEGCPVPFGIFGTYIPFNGALFKKGSRMCIKDGWDANFLYSEDFRFIVPAPSTPPSSPQTQPNMYNGLIVSPASADESLPVVPEVLRNSR